MLLRYIFVQNIILIPYYTTNRNTFNNCQKIDLLHDFL